MSTQRRDSSAGANSSEEEQQLHARLRDLSSRERRQLFLAPESIVGEYRNLPGSDKKALRSAVETWDEAAIKGYRLPQFWFFVRLLWRLRCRSRRWGESSGWIHSFVRRSLDEVTFAARQAPAWTGRWGCRAVWLLRERLSGFVSDTGPSVPAVLASQRVSPHVFAVCYCRGIRQRPRYRAFWSDPRLRQSVGCIVGLDFVPARGDGHFLLESNLNPAQRLERLRLYERDPFADNLIDFTSRHGYDELLILDSRFEGINPETVSQYRERARQRGIELTILDRPHLPNTPFKRSFGLPEELPTGALVVRLKSYPVSTDYLLTDKLATHRLLSLYKQAASEPDLHLPEAGVEPVYSDTSPDSPFPNIVVKRSDSGQGKRVVFAKVTSPDHAARLVEKTRSARLAGVSMADRVKSVVQAPGHIFQEYVRPRLLEGGHPYIVRAHVLLTPGNVSFLSAHRVVANRTVPEHLQLGIVEDTDPFVVNFSAASVYDRLPPWENQAVKRAALAVGRGFAWGLSRSFDVGPTEEKPPLN